LFFFLIIIIYIKSKGNLDPAGYKDCEDSLINIEKNMNDTRHADLPLKQHQLKNHQPLTIPMKKIRCKLSKRTDIEQMVEQMVKKQAN
jgi:hypothetical protein